jgi:DNA/RNA endonuclease G (NUC1)
MTRSEFLQLINLTEEFIAPKRENRPGTIIKPINITIHNTSNRSKGSDAKMHSKFVRETGYYILEDAETHKKTRIDVSWHFSVDDKITIKHLPLNEKAYHAKTEGNNRSLAIEICMHKGIVQIAANTRAARLAALLCFDLSIPIDSVVTHKHWTGKNCPELLIGTFDQFKKEIAGYLAQLKAMEPVAPKSEQKFLETAEVSIPLCWNDAEDTDLESTKSISEEFDENGFDEHFLSAGPVTLPALPANHGSFNDHVIIPHQNLSIYFNKQRKLALYTACNFDKEAFIKMGRSDAFREDENVKPEQQLGDGFYKSETNDKSSNSNFFDRGHLIARRYNQWGKTDEEARAGERDTYCFTSIHPQVGELNQEEWESLEDFIIGQGKLDIKRISVIAGALFTSNDPIAIYEDFFDKSEKTIQVPIVYWKIVYYMVDNELRKIAFLMSQKNRLKKLKMVTFREGKEKFVADPFDQLGDPLKTFVVKSELIASACNLTFAPAKELYDKDEPLEIVIDDNDTSPKLTESVQANFLSFV